MEDLEQRELKRLERTLSKKGSNNTLQRNTATRSEQEKKIQQDMTKKGQQKATPTGNHAPASTHQANEASKPTGTGSSQPKSSKNENTSQHQVPVENHHTGIQNAPQHSEGREADTKHHVIQLTILQNEQPSNNTHETSSSIVEQVQQLQQQIQDKHQDNLQPPENLQIKQQEVHFSCPFEGSAVFVAGTFNNWSFLPLTKTSDGKFETALCLPAGTYHYKYVVDNQWKCDPEKPVTLDADGHDNNTLVVQW